MAVLKYITLNYCLKEMIGHDITFSIDIHPCHSSFRNYIHLGFSELIRGLSTFRTKIGVIYFKTLIGIPMYTLEYDISEKSKKIEIGQSAGLKMDAILDFWSITGTSVS